MGGCTQAENLKKVLTDGKQTKWPYQNGLLHFNANNHTTAPTWPGQLSRPRRYSGVRRAAERADGGLDLLMHHLALAGSGRNSSAWNHSWVIRRFLKRRCRTFFWVQANGSAVWL